MNVIDPGFGPAPQHLERGSSVTHNSLEASQRPHISLIYRRHSRPRCVDQKALCKGTNRTRGGWLHSPLDSIKPYQRSGFAARRARRSCKPNASDNNRRLDRISEPREESFVFTVRANPEPNYHATLHDT